MTNRTLVCLSILLTLLLGHVATGDVLTMSDGRLFQGEIIREDASSVAIDTMVSTTIRTTLTFDRSAVESIDRQPLPKGFFEPPPPPPRAERGQDFAPQQPLFLEVPIKGRFGKEVWADGIAEIIRYARRHRVQHLVFVIDSDGGDIEEVKATYDLIRRQAHDLSLHALVKECIGDALAIPVWCNTVHVYPGAHLGGSAEELNDPADSADPAERQIVRAQVASEVIRQTGLKSPTADVVRAMIDPLQTLVAWTKGEDRVGVDVVAPAGLPEEDIIFRVGSGEFLVLSHDQAVQLGVPSFDGTPADLGAVLDLAGWEEESDFGRRTMAQTTINKRQEAAEATVAHNRAAEQNIRRREIVDQAFQESMKQAAEWSPRKGDYQVYGRRWGWGWGRRGGGGVMSSSTAQDEWSRRSQTTLAALRQAAQAVVAMERLDAEAVTLGLEPTYQPSDIHWMKQDIQQKYDYYDSIRRPGTVSTW